MRELISPGAINVATLRSMKTKAAKAPPPVRDQADIIGDHLACMRNLNRVQVVVVDFDSMLLRVINTVFGAIGRVPMVIIDKRHVLEVVRMPMAGYLTTWFGNGNEAYDAHERRIHHQSLRSLLNSRPDKLKREGLYEILRFVLAAHPDLAAVYDVKEKFFAIFSRRNRRRAETAFDALRASFSPLQQKVYGPSFAFIESRRDHVFNYFDHFITSAGTEARNGHIKDIYRSGQGGTP